VSSIRFIINRVDEIKVLEERGYGGSRILIYLYGPEGCVGLGFLGSL